MSISTAALGFPPELINIIQDRTLERVFHDALFARQLYRAEFMPELWAANLGERQVFTRAGLMPVNLSALVPGQDPTPGDFPYEQWEAAASQYAGTNDVHMPTNYVTLAPIFLRNIQQLGMNASQTLNRLARNKLFLAYLGGNTVTTAAAAAALSVIQVASLSGFSQTLLNGAPVPVSPASPLAVTFQGTEPGKNVIGAAPLNINQPFGPGLLTLDAPLSVGLGLREGVYAANRSQIVRVGGGATVDAINASNILTLQDIINAKAKLETTNVGPTADGFYHVHLSPTAQAQLFADNQFQRLWQSIPNDSPYRTGHIAELIGCRFYMNNETPLLTTVSATVADGGGVGSALCAPEIGADVVNQTGINIQRTIIIGGGVGYEKYIDESKFISDAGVTGKIGEFSIINNGVAVMTDRVRMILRAPLDRMQQIVGTSWSWSGDFPVPSDAFGQGSTARFKRAIVLESA